jgi:hypothetical protein
LTESSRISASVNTRARAGEPFFPLFAADARALPLLAVI